MRKKPATRASEYHQSVRGALSIICTAHPQPASTPQIGTAPPTSGGWRSDESVASPSVPADEATGVEINARRTYKKKLSHRWRSSQPCVAQFAR